MEITPELYVASSSRFGSEKCAVQANLSSDTPASAFISISYSPVPPQRAVVLFVVFGVEASS